MTDLTSPAATRLRQPRWTDARLVAGVLLVAIATALGATVLDAADRSVRVWAVRRALPAGITLARDDLVVHRVGLYGGDLRRYLDARADPAGRLLLRDIGAGDLLPRSAIGDPDGARATRRVALPVSRAHALGGAVRRGDRIDVLATRRTRAGRFTTYAVVRRVRVVDVSRTSGAFGASTRGDLVVVVEVDPADALRLTAAVQSAEIDVVLVVPGADGPGDVGAASVDS